VAVDDKDVTLFLCGVLTCSADVAEQVLARCRMRAFAGSTTIVRQGDKVSLAYLLVIGRAQALLCSADGQIVLLHEFHPGDFFGTLGELDPDSQDADIVAVDDVRALSIEGAQLALLAQQYGCIGLALSRLLLRRLRATTVRMYERAALSAVGRVYAELLRLARQRPDCVVSPHPVLSELALRVATTRETASRAVNALERRGIVRREAEALIVVAPHRLEALIL
jgi:CRP-like cAMP-binding protein